MPIYYIGRQRTLDFSSKVPIVQLISNPAVNGCQRCRYCYFCPDTEPFFETKAQYEACIREHACGRESLFWTKMSNGTNPPLDQPNDYTPTPLIRSVKVELQSRYIQFFTIDFSGYNCNSLCHYYPNRVATKQSIAACSNAHGCGRNGSFFRLLVILDASIFELPGWYNFHAPSGYATLPGDDQYEDISDMIIAFDSGDRTAVMCRIINGSRWYILNLLPGSPWCGCFLRSKRANNRDLLYWDTEGWLQMEDGDPCFILNTLDCTLADKLRDWGLTNDFLLYGRPYLTLISQSSVGDLWIYDDSSMWTIVRQEDTQYVMLRFIGLSTLWYVKIAISTDKWLSLENQWSTDYRPSKWTTTKTAPADLSTQQFLTITTPYDALAIFLQQIGVKESLFR